MQLLVSDLVLEVPSGWHVDEGRSAGPEGVIVLRPDVGPASGFVVNAVVAVDPVDAGTSVADVLDAGDETLRGQGARVEHVATERVGAGDVEAAVRFVGVFDAGWPGELSQLRAAVARPGATGCDMVQVVATCEAADAPAYLGDVVAMLEAMELVAPAP